MEKMVKLTAVNRERQGSILRQLAASAERDPGSNRYQCYPESQERPYHD
jgi:hypothetical protein